MSSELTIRLEHNLPPMAVEIVSPDFQVVHKLMLGPGESARVTVPSERSFLRVHHPRGEIITLADPGNLDRLVTEAAFGRGAPLSASPPPEAESEAQSATTRVKKKAAKKGTAGKRLTFFGGGGPGRPAWIDRAECFARSFKTKMARPDQQRTAGPRGESARTDECKSATPPPQGEVTVLLEGQEKTGPLRADQSFSSAWQPLPIHPPGGLAVALDTGARLALRLPGATRSCEIEVEPAGDDDPHVIRVRLRTNDPAADTILSYLQRGDIGAAAAMERWAESSHSMLQSKMSDPYAAAVGGYLLLRLNRFDLLHDWPRNLADWFDFLPDGCIIWAWQLLRQNADRRPEILGYLKEAVARGLPVYTPGLRLALDGLQLLGRDGQDALAQLQEQAGAVLWTSPLTAKVSMAWGSDPLRFEVGFASD